MPFVEVNGHKLHYVDSHPQGAPENGLTFVFNHGLGSTQNFYGAVTPYLTPNHRCIAFDTYGASRSVYTGQEITIASIAKDIIALMDSFKIPQAVVVGHSMGGLVVSLLGAEYADRIKGVVAIGPTYPSEGLSTVMKERAKLVASSGMEPLADAIPEKATAAGTSNLTKAFMRDILLNQNPEGYVPMCMAVANAPDIDYAAIKAPFLLIAGDEDKSSSMEGCETMYSLILTSNKRMEVLKHVGHWHCLEAPDEVGRILKDFVGKVSL